MVYQPGNVRLWAEPTEMWSTSVESNEENEMGIAFSQELSAIWQEKSHTHDLCMWMYCRCVGGHTLHLLRERQCKRPAYISFACVWKPYHSPLRVCRFMSVTLDFHSHSISRWWIGWTLPAATLGLVFGLKNCCSAALTDLPTWVDVPGSRTFSTSTLSPVEVKRIKKKWRVGKSLSLLRTKQTKAVYVIEDAFICLSNMNDCFMQHRFLSLKAWLTPLTASRRPSSEIPVVRWWMVPVLFCP